MVIRILNTLLILFAVYMGLKQGWAMVSGKPAMLEMFSKWHLGRTTVMIFGVLTLFSVVLMLFPATFLWGNFLMAASILLSPVFNYRSIISGAPVSNCHSCC